MVAIDVSEQREVAIPVNQHVFAAVVVEVAPHSAHRHSFTRPVEIRQPRTCGDFLKRAVPLVSIKGVWLTEAAVGEIQIRPSVAVKVGDGDRCSERRDMWLYARDLWIESWPVMDEGNSGRRGLVTERESGVRGVRGRTARPAIQSHREQQYREKRHADDGAPNGWARSMQHRSEYRARTSRPRCSPLNHARVVFAKVALVLRIARVRIPRSVRV